MVHPMPPATLTIASLLTFQRLIAETSRSITACGLALYAACPGKYANLTDLSFPAYIPHLAEALRTPRFADTLASAQELFGEPAQGLVGKALEALRQTFFDSIWQAASAQTWFPQEGGHSSRVARVAAALAEELGFSPSEIHEIHWGGLLHDVGKLFVGELFEALLAQGLPLEVTMPFIRAHASLGGEFMASVFPLFPTAQVCATHHQESVDGSGYPAGLRYEQLPLEGQIANLADGYDATVTRMGWTAQQMSADARQMYTRACHPQAPILQAYLRTIEKSHAAWYPNSHPL
jgi:HD-GYP domain-containing protein (c-di-GMP phosphodiesterase class II)